MYAQYIDHPIAQQPRPTVVYEMIMNDFYKGEDKIACPFRTRDRVKYVLLMPLTHMQWFTIPNSMRKIKPDKSVIEEGVRN